MLKQVVVGKLLLSWKQFNPYSNSARCLSKICYVYSTTQTNTYQNLAFEDWMYENVNFQKCNCLFIWRNEPSVVVGRHQNPWKECNVTDLLEDQVNICRRKSGGGAVYHDKGNVNFTFFTDRTSYDRKWNLNVIVSGLKQKWPHLNVSINDRDDILLNDFKISGSSSKLGRNTAYHHCTLLVSTNKEDIQKHLRAKQSDVTCNATESVRSAVSNLQDVDNSINFNDVCNAVTLSYTSNYDDTKLIDLNTSDEDLLPGVTQFAESLQSWEWIFGKTPNFEIKKKIEHSEHGTVLIHMWIKKGFISNVKIIAPGILSECDDISAKLIKQKFCQQDIMNALCYSPTSSQTRNFYDFLCGSVLSFV